MARSGGRPHGGVPSGWVPHGRVPFGGPPAPGGVHEGDMGADEGGELPGTGPIRLRGFFRAGAGLIHLAEALFVTSLAAIMALTLLAQAGMLALVSAAPRELLLNSCCLGSQPLNLLQQNDSWLR